MAMSDAICIMQGIISSMILLKVQCNKKRKEQSLNFERLQTREKISNQTSKKKKVLVRTRTF